MNDPAILRWQTQYSTDNIPQGITLHMCAEWYVQHPRMLLPAPHLRFFVKAFRHHPLMQHSSHVVTASPAQREGSLITTSPGKARPLGPSGKPTSIHMYRSYATICDGGPSNADKCSMVFPSEPSRCNHIPETTCSFVNCKIDGRKSQQLLISNSDVNHCGY